MTGFGAAHLVNSQSKVEESLISSMKGGSIQYNKITSIKAFDSEGFKIEDVRMNVGLNTEGEEIGKYTMSAFDFK